MDFTWAQNPLHLEEADCVSVENLPPKTIKQSAGRSFPGNAFTFLWVKYRGSRLFQHKSCHKSDSLIPIWQSWHTFRCENHFFQPTFGKSLAKTSQLSKDRDFESRCWTINEYDKIWWLFLNFDIHSSKVNLTVSPQKTNICYCVRLRLNHCKG